MKSSYKSLVSSKSLEEVLSLNLNVPFSKINFNLLKKIKTERLFYSILENDKINDTKKVYAQDQSYICISPSWCRIDIWIDHWTGRSQINNDDSQELFFWSQIWKSEPENDSFSAFKQECIQVYPKNRVFVENEKARKPLILLGFAD